MSFPPHFRLHFRKEGRVGVGKVVVAEVVVG